MAIHDERAHRGRQRFSDALEYRRGRRDGEMGRAPASRIQAYQQGYAEGRRALRRPRAEPDRA
jgi:hypothetical protein